MAPRLDTKLVPHADPVLDARLRQLPKLQVNRDLFDVSNRLPPTLPAGAAGKNLNGQVKLRVRVAESGDVRKVAVVHSSGSKLLDETARTWVQYIWRYPTASQETYHQEQIGFKTTKQERDYEAGGASIGRSIFPNTPRPPYPYVARKMNWQGVVRLNLIPDGQGNVKAAEIIGSSGVPLLDLIAKAWCESYWRLPNNVVTNCSITFRLG